MTPEQYKSLRTQIEATILQLSDSEVYLEQATQPIEPSVALGRLTRMEAIGEKSINEAMQVQVKLRLERLRNALQRMEAGTYGTCARCGKEILYGRLEAVPESVICVSCAEKRKG